MSHFKVKTRFYKQEDGKRPATIGNGTFAFDSYEMAITLNDMLNDVHRPKGMHCHSMVYVTVSGGFGAANIDVHAIDDVISQLQSVKAAIR